MCDKGITPIGIGYIILDLFDIRLLTEHRLLTEATSLFDEILG